MAYRGVLAAVVAGLLVTAGCSESKESSGTFAGDSPASSSPSEPPASPSEPPATTPSEPSEPSEPPEEPSRKDAAGGTAISVGARSWPYDEVGMDTATSQWIRDFGIDGMVYPDGDQVQLLEVIVFTIANSQDRSASLYYDFFSDQSAEDIAASFEQVIDELGDYTFSDETEGESLVLTAGGAGLSDRYEITVRTEPDQDRYTVKVVRNWSAGDDAVPAPVGDPLRQAISVADGAGFQSDGWRYYEGLDYDAYNESGARTFKVQSDYHLATASDGPDANVDLVASETPVTSRKNQQNGIVFSAAGAEWIFYNTTGGGGNIQLKR